MTNIDLMGPDGQTVQVSSEMFSIEALNPYQLQEVLTFVMSQMETINRRVVFLENELANGGNGSSTHELDARLIKLEQEMSEDNQFQKLLNSLNTENK